MSISDYDNDIQCFRHDYVIKRRAAHPGTIVDDEGRHIQSGNYDYLPFTGSAPQPLSFKDTQMLPDGFQDKRHLRFYTSEPILTFDDHIIYQDEDYRVMSVDTRETHVKVIILKLHRSVHD